MSENWYINFVKTSLEVIENSHVPLRSSKFSKKKYTQHQLLTSIFLKEKIGNDYRDFIELLPNLTTITDLLELKQIPHYTTLQKFLTRIPALIFRIILKNVTRILHQKSKKDQNYIDSFYRILLDNLLNCCINAFYSLKVESFSDVGAVFNWNYMSKTRIGLLV